MGGRSRRWYIDCNVDGEDIEIMSSAMAMAMRGQQLFAASLQAFEW